MNNTRLERQVESAVSDLMGYIDDLKQEITDLESLCDRKDEEIEKLVEQLTQLS